MSVRALYLVAGAAWGTIFAILVGLAAYLFVFGVSWLYIFGDDPWPAASVWFLPILAALASIAAFAACVAVGWYFGGQVASSATGQGRARRVGIGALGAGAATAVALVVLAIVSVEQDVADRQDVDAQEAALERLEASRHIIDRISFFGWNADTGTAGIILRGNRSGDYQVSWQVSEPTYGRMLAEGRESVKLGPGRRTVVIALGRTNLIESYREKILSGKAAVVVDEAFRLTATVEVVLSPTERASLPPRELQNLAIGESVLRSAGEADVPMSFRTAGVPGSPTD